MRGSSGATIDVFGGGGRVKKTGDERTGDQGAMLMRIRGEHLPRVLAANRTSYVMEKLGELPWQVIDSHVGDAIVAALVEDVWSQPAVVEMDHDAHLEKVRSLARTFLGDCGTLVGLHGDINWDELEACQTHGDPTADNLMLRADGTLVVIDPIPATPAVPDLQSVDMGKIATSVLGFERARYGEFPIINSLTLSTLSANEFRATKYWAAVHLLRSLPYMPSRKVRDDVAALIPTALCF